MEKLQSRENSKRVYEGKKMKNYRFNKQNDKEGLNMNLDIDGELV